MGKALADTVAGLAERGLRALARRYGIALIVLFGSRVRGDARVHSDLDIGVWFAGNGCHTPQQLNKLDVELARLFADDVHVVALNHTNPELCAAIVREGHVLYERAPGLFARFGGETLHRLHQYYCLRRSDRDFVKGYLQGRNEMTQLYATVEARRILVEMVTSLERLREVEKRSLKAYLTDWKTMTITERLLILIVNYAIDVNRFLLQTAGVQMPNSYYETFIAVGRLRIISGRLAVQLAGTTAVRNRLEHEYDTIDQTRIYVLTKKFPRWYRSYIAAVNRWLDAEEARRDVKRKT